MQLDISQNRRNDPALWRAGVLVVELVRVEHWSNAGEQGGVVARNLLNYTAASTNDTLLLVASGHAGNPEIVGTGTAEFGRLATTVLEVAQWLAQAIVRDGEGATKFITVTVEEGASRKECFHVAKAIANSPLVKTALAGEDANWGRVVMAVGKAGEPADRDKLSIGFGGTWAAREGLPVADYDEAPVAAHLEGEVRVTVIATGLLSSEEEPNRFLVGDVKQSIYRFRLADPRIFQEYERRWREADGGRVISLQENFRSREALIHFFNAVFSDLMQEPVGRVSFDEHARLSAYRNGDAGRLRQSSVDGSCGGFGPVR